MGVRAALTELKAVTWAKPKAVRGQTCPYPWQFHLAGHLLHFWGPHPAFRIPRLLPSPPTFLPLSLRTTKCPVLENSLIYSIRLCSTSILKPHWMAASLPCSQNRDPWDANQPYVFVPLTPIK